ncbi:hypothetical protein OC842_004914 [Tilletia horrida]|uniref:Uncharacterized protein n=1 Tax=Tilletia horrida TaxID=155126 RepID=A0AAN6G8B7_9BASI|nr:hypothetical protein OC842_004914 [Tilletia horrida]
MAPKALTAIAKRMLQAVTHHAAPTTPITNPTSKLSEPYYEATACSTIPLASAPKRRPSACATYFALAIATVVFWESTASKRPTTFASSNPPATRFDDGRLEDNHAGTILWMAIAQVFPVMLGARLILATPWRSKAEGGTQRSQPLRTAPL